MGARAGQAMIGFAVAVVMAVVAVAGTWQRYHRLDAARIGDPVAELRARLRGKAAAPGSVARETRSQQIVERIANAPNEALAAAELQEGMLELRRAESRDRVVGRASVRVSLASGAACALVVFSQGLISGQATGAWAWALASLSVGAAGASVCAGLAWGAGRRAERYHASCADLASVVARKLARSGAENWPNG